MIYTLYYSEYGTPTSGLSPTIDVYINSSDGSTAGGPPGISDLSGGFYSFSATAPNNILCRIDSNNANAADVDRYKVMQITANDGDLDSPISEIKAETTVIKAQTDKMKFDGSTNILAAISSATIDLIKAETTAIKAKTDLLPNVTINDWSASALDKIWDEEVESTMTARGALRVFLAALGGKSTGGGTTQIFFRDLADSVNRIVATVDSNGNRTAITLVST